MINKSDLQTASREVMAERRQRLGDPPTTAEVEAYFRGTLDAGEEERVRELLVAYPELARGLAQDFPPDEPQPGQPGFVTDAEIARQFAALQHRLGVSPATADRGRVLYFRYVPAALAAAAAIVFAGLYWQAETRVRRIEQEVGRPRAVSYVQLRSGAQRGGGSEMTLESIPAGLDRLVEIPVRGAAFHDAYAVEIAELGTNDVLWKVNGARRRDDVVAITLPHDALPSGRYSVNVFGVTGATRQVIDTFAVRVP